MPCVGNEVEFVPYGGFLGENYHTFCVDNTTSDDVYFIVNDDEADDYIDYASDQDSLWLIVAGSMVFLMQAGFAMLEAGSVSHKNTVNILFKNLLDASIAAIAFWLFGYAFAYGTSGGGFIGGSNFGLTDEGDAQAGWEEWFFQWAFAATAATIVSGCVAERTKFTAYLVYSVVLTAFIYPVVVHWGWGDGWLSAWAEHDEDSGPLLSMSDTSNGMIDFAGSGIVHMVGGFAGLVGAIVVGPRTGRFGEPTSGFPLGQPQPMPGHSVVLQALGVFILWWGWYGFNAGSTLCTVGCMDLAAKVAVNTTLAAAACVLTTTFFVKAVTGTYDLSKCLNSAIAGLVSITGPCSVVEPYFAILIGVIGAFVYLGSDRLLLMARVDDPLSACPLHGFCGIWGVLAVGIFATDDGIAFADYPNAPNDAVGRGEQIVVQIIGIIAILAWTLTTSAAMFLGIKYTMGMRVSQEVETEGLDSSEHGAAAYIIE